MLENSCRLYLISPPAINLPDFSKQLKLALVGFTLVEISIVLVIIGLLVGGVMVGQDLIYTAKVRSQISQIEQYNTAVSTFKLKYGGLPGDIKNTEAAGFGFYTATYAGYLGCAGYGDGNGLIEGGNVCNEPANNNLNGEPCIFWRQLGESNLIAGKYGSLLNTAAELGGGSVLSYLPSAILGSNSTIQVGSPNNGNNYFVIADVQSVVNYDTNSKLNALTAKDSHAIDSKIDDGLPATGNIIAINATSNLYLYPTWTNISAVGGCVTASTYALTQTTKSCSLRIKFQ